MRESTPELPPEDDWANDLTGAVLDERYQVESLLGTGGMGAVYLGQQITLRKPVAIKVLRPEYAHREIYVRRFLREARAASMIGHRNVVEVTDFGQAEGGRVYFVMEYLEGEDLAKLVHRQGRLSWERSREILLQMVRALKVAHAKGVIHRDIKPANVFLVSDDDGDYVKVLDFGIAKVADPLEKSAEGLTSSNQMIGTAMYMAPEQALGRVVDARSDVYSVGAVAFQLLCGRVPFAGVTAFEVLMKRVNEPPPSVRPLAPELTGAIDDLVRRAMARDPVARFQDMAELEAALLAIPADAAPPPHKRQLAVSADVGAADVAPAYDPDSTELGTRTSARRLAQISSSPSATVAYDVGDAPVAPPASADTGSIPQSAVPTEISGSQPQPRAETITMDVAQPRSYAWVAALAIVVALVLAGYIVMGRDEPGVPKPASAAAAPAPGSATTPSSKSAAPPSLPDPQPAATETGSAANEIDEPETGTPTADPVQADEPGDGAPTPDPTKSDPTKSDPTKSDPTKSDSTKSGPRKPKSKSPPTVAGLLRTAKKRAARSCKGQPGGRVEVQFLVDSGKANLMSTVSSTETPEVTQCVRGKVTGTKFPSGPHGMQRVIVSF